MRIAAIVLALLALPAAAAARHIPFGDPALPEVVSCGDQASFRLAALRSRPFYERRRTRLGAGLRRFVREHTELAGEFPLRGFRLVARSRYASVFAAGHGAGMASFTFELRAGRWKVVRYGGCRLEPVSESGSAADWKLDPAAPPPGPASTEIPLLVNERECASGEAATGRIQEPVVFADDRRVVVSVFVREVEGGAECPGNPDTPYTLRLAEPLGERALFDGGTVPARRRSQR